MQMRYQWQAGTESQRRRLREERFDFELKRSLFLQHDMNVANASGATVRADLNNALQSLATVSSGATAPATTFAYMLWADTTANLLKQRNAANSGWIVRGTLAETMVVARSSNTILAAADFHKTFNCTSTFTQTLTAAATLGDGWHARLRNNGTGVITIDANSTETIDGLLTIKLQPGEDCWLWCNGSGFITFGRAGSALPAYLLNNISGLLFTQNGSDPDNDVDIAVGACSNSTNVLMLVLASAITKRLDAGWAVGTNQGGLDGSESVAGTPDVSTWYYIHLIMRSDTGVVDALFSESATAPTMPTNYDYRRLIGAVFNDSGGNIADYHAYETAGGGVRVMWDTFANEISLTATLGTTARLDTIRVPTAFATLAHILGRGLDASTWAIFISCPDTPDTAPSITGVAPHGQLFGGANIGQHDQFDIMTSATGQIRSRASLTTIDDYFVVTLGFSWARR